MATAKNDQIKKITIFDVASGEAIERELTEQEILDLNSALAEGEARQAEAQARAAARESALAKLADLGLTAEEIAAL